MLTNQLIDQRIAISRKTTDHVELNRLLAAAVVNQHFRNLLLTNPAVAIRDGYGGEKFSLSDDEHNMILSIHASSLVNFAEQLSEKMKFTYKSA
jgi:hypothetical protein